MIIIENKKGQMSIIFVLILAAMVLTSILTYTNYYVSQKTITLKLIYSTNLTILQRRIESYILNPKSFEKTMNSNLNPSLRECLQNPTVPCSANTPLALNLISENLNVDDSILASDNFNTEMKKCTGFPSLSCPFHFNIVWDKECPTAMPCLSPGYIVRVTTLVSPQFQSKVILNTSWKSAVYRIR